MNKGILHNSLSVVTHSPSCQGSRHFDKYVMFFDVIRKYLFVYNTQDTGKPPSTPATTRYWSRNRCQRQDRLYRNGNDVLRYEMKALCWSLTFNVWRTSVHRAVYYASKEYWNYEERNKKDQVNKGKLALLPVVTSTIFALKVQSIRER